MKIFPVAEGNKKPRQPVNENTPAHLIGKNAVGYNRNFLFLFLLNFSTMKRKATAVWNGTIKEGSGHITTASTVLDKTQYSFNSRFADGVGTNPEELLAAAHAGCFSMKLSLDLTEAGFKPESLETESTVTLEDGKVVLSRLSLKAKVPGIGDGDFQEIARKAKDTCPISVAFSFPIELEAVLL